ncbi:hypothetical protein WSM22_46340 [Cytophagales bacterium WSM2-2]|nr:hypothetical protein WSM22_46340 [Cytophagales bacterium WSM2-2]
MGSDSPVDQIVLFDGVCNLCSSSVQFILRHNKKQNLRFASLQSDYGQQQLKNFQMPSELKTILFVKGDKVFVRSSAILEICRELDGLYPVLYVYKVIPPFIRDGIYDFIARHRYQWFGKKNECWLPTPEFTRRFIA